MSKSDLQKRREKRYTEASNEIRSMDDEERLNVYENYVRLRNILRNLIGNGLRRGKPK